MLETLKTKVIYPPSLDQICDHDNDEDILLPDHPPERFEGVFERTLSADVGVALLIAVDVVAVDVVARLLLTDRRKQSDSALVI